MTLDIVSVPPAILEYETPLIIILIAFVTATAATVYSSTCFSLTWLIPIPGGNPFIAGGIAIVALAAYAPPVKLNRIPWILAFSHTSWFAGPPNNTGSVNWSKVISSLGIILTVPDAVAAVQELILFVVVIW